MWLWTREREDASPYADGTLIILPEQESITKRRFRTALEKPQISEICLCLSLGYDNGLLDVIPDKIKKVITGVIRRLCPAR